MNIRMFFSQRFLHFSFERWDDVLLFHAEDFFWFRVVMIQPCLVRGHYAVEEVFFMWIPPQKCLRKLNSSISSFSVSNLGIQRAATLLIFRWSLRIVKIVPELTLNISASSETVTRPSFSKKSNIESLPQENLSMPFINKSTTHFWQISRNVIFFTFFWDNNLPSFIDFSWMKLQITSKFCWWNDIIILFPNI